MLKLSHYQKLKLKLPSNRPKRGKNLVCQTCGGDFYVYPSRLKAGQVRFCSVRCYTKVGEGNPSFGKSYNTKTLSEKLLDKFYINEFGCWIWTGAVGSNGYGNITLTDSSSIGDRTYIQAHRASWLIFRSEVIPAELMVCHRCDIKLCINPDHLFLGTNSENIQDMITKKKLGLFPNKELIL